MYIQLKLHLHMHGVTQCYTYTDDDDDPQTGQTCLRIVVVCPMSVFVYVKYSATTCSNKRNANSFLALCLQY